MAASFKFPKVEAKTSVSGRATVEVVAVFQDSGKKPIPPKGGHAAAVEKLRKAQAFLGKAGSTAFVRFGGGERAESVLFVGMGMAAELTEEKARVAGGNVWGKLAAERADTVVVDAESFARAAGLSAQVSGERVALGLAEGMLLCCYKYSRHRSGAEGGDEGVSKLSFLSKDRGLSGQLSSGLSAVVATAEAVRITRDWSNEPSNHGTPEYYAAEAVKLAKQYGLKCKVLSEADARREKMGLFLGVGQGAEREGKVVIVEYTPKAASAKTVALVGKGITFDSGGISIKPSLKMEDMKHDMTGAATVMGATILASLWKAPNRIVAVMGFTENMPDGTAIQPGNVITSRAGKTVEVINTDAEGRLILADLLDLAQDYKPDAVIDIATLTGAVGVALGKQACAVLGNDDAFVEAVRRAGDDCGERTWQLPLWDEYFEDLKSDWADMRNSANDALGGTIRGAIFLKQFIRKGVPWAHLDIAATAWSITHLSYLPKKGASGSYVRTLAKLVEQY